MNPSNTRRSPSLPRRRGLAGIAALLALSLAGVRPTAAAGPAHVKPERIAEPGSWTAPQFVQADAAGHVVLLRSDTLEVYPLTPKGTFAPPANLERFPTAEDHPFIRDAALAPGGDEWVLLDVGHGPRSFRDGKERQIPVLGWRATAVVMAGGRPVVAALPAPARDVNLVARRDGKVALDSAEPPPLLLSLGESGWETVAREDYDFGSLHWPEANGKMYLLRDARLAADAKGNLWLAEEFGYRLRKFTPAGRLLAQLAVGKGKPAVKERSPAELAAELGQQHQATGRKPDPASLRFSAPRAVDGLVATRDGRVYVLVEVAADGKEARLALDRFDPSVPSLERLVLDGVAGGGRFSLAAGRDALYLAAFSGEDGMWRLPWDILDGARWERVGKAAWNGESLP